MAGDGQDVQGAGLRIPPDWVPFLRIPQCVEDCFGIQIDNEWLQDLWSLVRKNSPIIVYRVAGTRVADFPTRAFQFDTLSSAGFPGLQPSQHGSGHITVADWDEAGFDPQTFTVIGRQLGGNRVRQHIELRWMSVEKWVRDRMERDQKPTPSSPRTPRPYSLEHLRAEYILRVSRWTDDNNKCGNLRPPSPEDDMQWAKSIFSNVPRIALRKIRKEKAPESWKKRGKKTGENWRD